MFILLSNIDEYLQKETQRFDVVTAMEVIEHVNDMDSFLRNLQDLLRVCLKKENHVYFIKAKWDFNNVNIQ